MTHPWHEQCPAGGNRRQFLKGLVAVAVGAASTAGSLGTGATASAIEVTLPHRFGRMFPGLPPFAPANDAIRAALMELGKPGGLLDAQDDLTAWPVALIVDPAFSANLAGDHGQPFFGLIFDLSQEGAADPDDLRGGVRAPRRFISWQTFFDFGDGHVKPSKKIDTKLSTPLFNLPFAAIADGNPPTALAQRNLLRHLTWQLPSGQAIALRMSAPVLSREHLAELWSIHPSFDRSTPLWYYVLKEAALMQEGRQLGPVGGRIVGEVFIGLLQTDSDAYLNLRPDWKPTLPTKAGTPEDFRMIDFLTFAGVDPTSRGQ